MMFRTEHMILRARFLAVGLGLVLLLGTSAANGEKRVAEVDRLLVVSELLPFDPVEGILVVSCGYDFTAVQPAIVVQTPDELSAGAAPPPHRSILGSMVGLPSTCQNFEVFGIFTGDDGRRFQSDVQSMSLDDPDLVLNNPQLLQSSAMELRKGVRSLELKVRETEDEERRLSADADLILNIERMVQTHGDALAPAANVDPAIERSTDGLQSALMSISNDTQPDDFYFRERVLTAVLRETAVASRDAVATERARRERGENEVERKLALIQASRFEDLDALRNELRALQDRRKRLELEAGIHDSREKGSIDPYE